MRHFAALWLAISNSKDVNAKKFGSGDQTYLRTECEWGTAGDETKTEGSLVEFKSRAPLPFHWPGSHQRSPRRAIFDAAWPLKWCNGSGARDLNSTRLPSFFVPR